MKKRGRPKKEYPDALVNLEDPSKKDRMLVKFMKIAGSTHEQIAAALNIDAKILTATFADELTNGKTMCNAMVIGKLFEMAMGGCKASAIFWAKAQCGWTEKQEITHRADIQPVIVIGDDSKDTMQ